MSYLDQIAKLMVVGKKKETDPNPKAPKDGKNGKAKTAASIAVAELLEKYYSNR
jgi:hypothetical protein